MPSINFYLDKPDSEGKCPIFLVYQSKGRKFKHYTKEKILQKYWDKKKQRAKSIADAAEINDLLSHLAGKLKTIERQLRITNDAYSFDEVKLAFLNRKEKNVELFEFLPQIVEQVRGTHQVKSLREYNTVINDLKAFERYSKSSLSFEKIDVQFFSKFLGYLFDVKGNSQNTVAKKVSTFRTLLNYATKAGVNSKLDYKEFKVKKIKTEKSFLTEEELFRMYNLDLSNHKKLERVRDVFCFGCFTGLRFSDIEALKFEDIIEKKNADGEPVFALKFHVHKTRQLLEVPLIDYALEIIKKYESEAEESIKAINADLEMLKKGRKVLPVISNQKTNEYLKEVAKLAKIDKRVVVTKFIGTKREDNTYYKYELLATHAARRTFAIISLEKGMRVEVLQKILGHASIRTTMKYVFILEEVKMQEMHKVWNTE